MVFGDDESYLIDFDFVGKDGIDCYPNDYNSRLPERHKNAIQNGRMMLVHDRHSLKVTIEQNVRGLAKEAPILTLLESSTLREVLTCLQSAGSWQLTTHRHQLEKNYSNTILISFSISCLNFNDVYIMVCLKIGSLAVCLCNRQIDTSSSMSIITKKPSLSVSYGMRIVA